eukprot:1343311-Rhodomonas_salina.1
MEQHLPFQKATGRLCKLFDDDAFSSRNVRGCSQTKHTTCGMLLRSTLHNYRRYMSGTGRRRSQCNAVAGRRSLRQSEFDLRSTHCALQIESDSVLQAAEVAQLEAAEAVADASIEYQAGKGIPSLGVPPPRIDQDDATVYSPDGAWALPPVGLRDVLCGV